MTKREYKHHDRKKRKREYFKTGVGRGCLNDFLMWGMCGTITILNDNGTVGSGGHKKAAGFQVKELKDVFDLIPQP